MSIGEQAVTPVRTLIVGISEHQQRNMNLQKGDPTAVCRPCSPMIKSAQDVEEEADSLRDWNKLIFTS